MEFVANLKITPQVLVDVVKVKMIFSHGSIAILIYAAMVMSLKLACAESLINRRFTALLVHPVDSTDRSVNSDSILNRPDGEEIPVENQIPAIILNVAVNKDCKSVQKIKIFENLKETFKMINCYFMLSCSYYAALQRSYHCVLSYLRF